MLHNPWMPSDQLMLCDPVDAARPLDATRPMKATRHVDAMETGDTAEIVDLQKRAPEASPSNIPQLIGAALNVVCCMYIKKGKKWV